MRDPELKQQLDMVCDADTAQPPPAALLVRQVRERLLLDDRLRESSEAADAFQQQLTDLSTATRSAAIGALEAARNQGN